jgi:hypothetical protein
MSHTQDLPKLLRAMASGTDAKEARQDVILNIAADEIERLRRRVARPVEFDGHFPVSASKVELGHEVCGAKQTKVIGVTISILVMTEYVKDLPDANCGDVLVRPIRCYVQ